MFRPGVLPSTARRGAIGLLAVGLLGGAASPVGAAQRVLVGQPTNGCGTGSENFCTGPSELLYKPKNLWLVAMDEGVRVRSTNLRWTGWGTAKAVGKGSARLGDEDNGFYTAKVTVRLTKIVKAGCSDDAGKYRAYSQATLVEGTGAPTGDSIRFRTLGC